MNKTKPPRTFLPWEELRGRLDEGRITPPREGASQELVEAMRAIATTGVAPAETVL